MIQHALDGCEVNAQLCEASGARRGRFGERSLTSSPGSMATRRFSTCRRIIRLSVGANNDVPHHWRQSR
jgi:hypothetical protein